jgi:hypothetical protein
MTNHQGNGGSKSALWGSPRTAQQPPATGNGSTMKIQKDGSKVDEDGSVWSRAGQKELVHIKRPEEPTTRRFDLLAEGTDFVSVPFGTKIHLPNGTIWVRIRTDKKDKVGKLEELRELLRDLRGDRSVAISGKGTVVLSMRPQNCR